MSESAAIDQHQLRGFDSTPLRPTSLADLDLDRVREHILKAKERGRYTGPDEPEAYLTQHRCIAPFEDTVYATPAGILCFGRAPQAILPHAVVDLGHYRGVDAVSTEVTHLQKNIGGTIFDQIEWVEQYLWTHSYHGMTIGAGARRIELHEYPRVVIRELVVNMIAHRDYSLYQSSARVQKFRDRTEWISPGGLPEGVFIEHLLEAQASRNTALVQILFDAGLVEAFGMGLDTVVRVLKQEEMEPPRFDDLKSIFMVTVFGRPLELFTSADAAARLSDRQRRLLTFIRAKRDVTPRDMLELFDDHVTLRSLQRDLKELQDAGLIEPTGKGRATRYVIVDLP